MSKTRIRQNPYLRERKLSNGNKSLYLEYNDSTTVFDSNTCKSHKVATRRKEYLSLVLYARPKNFAERAHNNEVLERARQIRAEAERKILNGEEQIKRHINFLEYFKEHITGSPKRCSGLKCALKRFQEFLQTSPKYSLFANRIEFEQLNKEMMGAFVEFLKSKSRDKNKSVNGANTYYTYFKQIINYAVDNDILKKNPCKGITIHIDIKGTKKNILSFEEIQKLSQTHYDNENIDIKRAFLFCCNTGIRHCDVRELMFSNIINFPTWQLQFDQKKTEGRSTCSHVAIPLKGRDDLLQLIGKKPTNPNTKIFNLPYYVACLRELKRWVKAAGIDRNITWHCSRHSFATYLLAQGADIKTTATLLGHSSLRYVDIYASPLDKRKEEAINSLPRLDVSSIVGSK